MKKTEPAKLYETALAEAKKKTPDNQKVFELLNLSMEAGEPKAAYAIGTWYLHGFYVKKNIRTAVKLLRLAAEENVTDALFDLANCYETGVGVKKNEKLAFHCYLKAALRSDKQSIYEVGRCYFYGIGTDSDKKLAKIWLDRAKELGIEE